MHTLGAGLVASSLNVRGDDIYPASVTTQSSDVEILLFSTYLVWRVANADVKIRQLHLHDIPK